MPANKDLKRRVRDRMTKTGESYTTARLQLVKKKQPRPIADAAARAGMSDETVRAKTGKTWEQWARTLDAIGGTSLSHRELAAHVHDQHGVSGWWSQMVTVGYERIRGLRERGQRLDGGYEANKSKTVPVAVSRLYRAFATKREREAWLGKLELTVRKATPSKSMRIQWEDGTAVDVYFMPKDKTKSSVAIQHRKLASRADADRLKQFWAERLDTLGESLASRRSER